VTLTGTAAPAASAASATPTAGVVAPSAEAIAAFEAAFDGQVVLPDSDDYDARRLVFNRRIQRHPAVIARPASAAGVASAVAFARANGLPIAVRSGGHSLSGLGTTDGLVIDLGSMKGLAIDAAARTVRAEAGLTAGEVTHAATEFGLAVPFGDTASVGIGGLTLGGGVGWLVRRYGLTIDSLLEVELVTADGRIVTASADEHPDLFWAVRGGGGNFGVVTAFSYGAHPVGLVFGGMLALPATADNLRAFERVAAAAPRDLTTIVFLMHLPPMPFLPAELHGRLAIVAGVVYAGDPANGPAAVAPLRAIDTPLADTLAPMPYPAIYELTRDAETPVPGFFRGTYLPTVDGPVADDIIAFMERAMSPLAFAQFRFLGGAMADVPSDETAFAHRDASVLALIVNVFTDGEPATHEAWSEAFFAAIHSPESGVYVNFVDDGDERIHEAYPEATLTRLAAIKADWDPDNVFALNLNVRPAATAG
jgi:FAD/FMN-containing dehydrogenase